MNLKYYLRGLGIGIVVTALIMGIAGMGQKESLSNEEIKQRASELGMVEAGTTLAEAVSTPKPEADEEAAETEISMPEADEEAKKASSTAEPEETAKPTAEPEATAKPTAKADATAKPTAKADATAKPTMAPENADTTQAAGMAETDEEEMGENAGDSDTTASAGTSAEAVVIEISSGDSSYFVCQKLEQAGLVASASSYDMYLCQNGYDRKLRAGSHEIPAGAKDEEIARILAGMQ